MKIITKEELKIKKESMAEKIKDGAVFIHPTDTIYGLGCDATNEEAVERIRKAKQRPERPFSVIAPSKEWIMENCIVDKDNQEWIEKLPGPYTLILNLKNKQAVSSSVNKGLDSIGVRMLDHHFNDFVKELDRPILTTSANVVGENRMVKIENLDPRIRSKLDFAIYEGEKQGKASTIINLTKGKPEIKER